MGANELGMWHHNAERPLVHLGARVPMQPRGMMGGGGGGGGEVMGVRKGRGLDGAPSLLCPVLSPLATTNHSAFPRGALGLPACLPARTW